MQRIMMIVVAVIIIFVVALLVTFSARKKRVKAQHSPLFQSLLKYQDDILDKGYDISFTTKPSNMKVGEDLLYQSLGKIAKVDFDLENPESESEGCNMWISDDRLLLNLEKTALEFNLEEIKEFEFELDEVTNDFLFSYKDRYFKVSTKDLYFVALLDLKLKKYEKTKKA